MTDRLDAILRRSPAQHLFSWRASRQLAVLAYHAVDDPQRFGAHVDYLRREWQPVSLDEVLAATGRRRALPRRAALITFDDADRTVLDRARPLLEAGAVPAVAFVVTGLLDTDRPVWTREARQLAAAGGTTSSFPGASPDQLVVRLKRVQDDVRLKAMEELRQTARDAHPSVPQLRVEDLSELESAGISVENHSSTHACLPRCLDDKVRTEIVEAHEALQRAVGRTPRAFAYPNGDHDARAADLLRALGYGAAFTFDHRHSAVPPSDPLAISRVRVNSTDSVDRLRIVLSGLHPALLRLRGRLRPETEGVGRPVRRS